MENPGTSPRHSLEAIRSLAEHSSDGLALVDADGVFTYVNPGISRLTGLTVNELLGRPQLDIIHPEDLPSATDALAQVLVDPRTVKTVEARTRHKRGHWTWIEIRAMNRLRDPNVGALVLTYHDITDRKEALEAKEILEAQLRQSQKMEAVGRLAGGIAHDFNNLLSIVMNYSALVAETLDEHDARQEDLREIRHAAAKASNLVRQLLAFSRQEVNKPEVIDVNEAIDDFVRMLTRTIREDVVVSVKKAIRPWLTKIDPTQLDQILMNLAVNARDAMPTGGSLLIETRNETVDETVAVTQPGLKTGTYVTILVSDTGCGMPSAVVENVFEPFFTTKARHEGTGLGLSTVYGIVKQAGGYISVYSEVDLGTTFKIYLPTTSGSVMPSADSRHMPAMPTGSERILLVEDDRAVRILVSRLLRGAGYTVIAASSGDEALELIEHSQRIDLLITDVIMPNMSGNELARRIVAESRIPVLFMSGYSEEMAARQGVLKEKENFIQKPFTASELLVKLRRAIAQDQRVS